MRNNILSLKNIYNLLVMKDYPVEGGSVISGDRKKGMTLTKFWKEKSASAAYGGQVRYQHLEVYGYPQQTYFGNLQQKQPAVDL